MKEYYVWAKWEDWPNKGYYACEVTAEDTNAAARKLQMMMAEIRRAETGESVDDLLDKYRNEWTLLRCHLTTEFSKQEAGKVLTLQQMIKVARDLGLSGLKDAVAMIEEAGRLLADQIGEEYKVVPTYPEIGAPERINDYAATFYPASDRQPCPEILANLDGCGNWLPRNPIDTTFFAIDATHDFQAGDEILFSEDVYRTVNGQTRTIGRQCVAAWIKSETFDEDINDYRLEMHVEDSAGPFTLEEYTTIYRNKRDISRHTVLRKPALDEKKRRGNTTSCAPT